MTWAEGQPIANPAANDGGDDESNNPTERGAEVTGRSGSANNNADENEGSGRRASNDPMAALARAAKKRAAEIDPEVIDKVEDAVEGDKLIVLFVYSSSEDRKFARSTEASKKFETEVLGQFDVATALQDTTNVKLNGEELSKEIRKKYSIAAGAPQLLLIDPTGKVLAKFNANASAETVVKMIESAKEHTAKLVAKRD
ncbi:MAG: hypothetical protein AB7K09_10565 [Planctomycetota bacterium]